MIRNHSVPLALIPALALTLAVGACGDDGTSPVDLHGLEPAAVATAVNALAAPLQGPNEAITNLGAARADLAAAGVDLDWSAESTVQFPDHVTGSTFVYDAGEQAWVIDESRTGAPADGVRVIWYRLDSTGRVVGTSESGHIDIQPADRAGTAPIAVRVVEFSTDAAPLLNFSQDYSWTSNGDEVESFDAEGSYSNDERTVSFSLESTETLSTATGDAAYSYESVMQDIDTRYELAATGTTDGATSDYDDIVTATIDRGGSTTVVEVRFQGTGAAQQQVDGSVRHNGTTVALVDLRSSGYAFTTPDGGELSLTQSSEMNALFQSATLNGFLLLYDLPLFFPTD